MPRTSITFLLLLTVFAGQIFGGKSCCCSSRILGQIAINAVSILEVITSVASEAPTVRNNGYRCPHCAIELAVRCSSTPLGDRLALCGPSGCNCIGQAITAISERAGPIDQKSLLDQKSLRDFAPHFDTISHRFGRCVESAVAFPFEECRPHVSYPSWQSLACIWRL